MDRSLRFTAWVGLFGAALLTAVSPQLLTLIYGPAFRAASHSFSILVWMLPVAMLSGHHRYILIAYNRQRQLLWCTVVSAGAAVVLGFALVPFYGGPGAACVILIALLINFVLVYVAVKRLVVEVPVHRELARPLMALAVSLAFGLALAKWSFWVAVGGASAVYLAGLLRSDGRALASFLRTIIRRPIASGELTIDD